MGQGREDKGERIQYFVDTKPVEVFGADEPTTPPVIGDRADSEEDDDSSEG